MQSKDRISNETAFFARSRVNIVKYKLEETRKAKIERIKEYESFHLNRFYFPFSQFKFRNKVRSCNYLFSFRKSSLRACLKKDLHRCFSRP